jgi:uncharacterized protein (TIGR02996 family)
VTKELETAIDEDPYDRASWEVYLDWLQEQGDPRGEPGPAKPSGPLKKFAKTKENAFGNRHDAFTWRNGFIVGFRASGPDTKPLEALLAHPAGRFLTEVTWGFSQVRGESLQDAVDLLAKKAPKSLRSLHLEDFSISEKRRGITADLSKHWAAFARLTSLTIAGGECKLGAKIVLPALERAKFRIAMGWDGMLAAISRSKAPALRELAIDFEGEYCGDLAPLLARTDLPALRRLALTDLRATVELRDQLPVAKLLPQLTHLDLSGGWMTDWDVEPIVEHKQAFAHLEVLDVSKNHLSPKGVRSLQGCAKVLKADGQRDPDEDPDGEDDFSEDDADYDGDDDE